jgi:hypothetical protein
MERLHLMKLPSDAKGGGGGAQGVAGINRNGWPTSIGIGGRLAAEYAIWYS